MERGVTGSALSLNALPWIIGGMVVVTYVPRLLPFVMRGKRELPAWQQRALRLVPFAAIGALILPDGLAAVGGDKVLSLLGLAVAALAGALVKQPFFVVVAAVAAVVIVQAVV